MIPVLRVSELPGVPTTRWHNSTPLKATADAAIVILESRMDIQIVFTDIHMPGSMDGAKLAHAIKDRWPPVRIIATSGRVAVETLDLPAGTMLFPKPYSVKHIAWTLHALTGAQ
jgi:two-component system, response regulator PdtaR